MGQIEMGKNRHDLKVLEITQLCFLASSKLTHLLISTVTAERQKRKQGGKAKTQKDHYS